MPRFLFRPADQRLAAANDELLVFVGGLGVFAGEKVEVRFAHGFFRVFKAEFPGKRLADFQETRLPVFEIDVVRNVVEQRAQQVALVSQRLLDFPAFGDVPEHSLHANDVADGVVKRRLDHLHVNLPVRGLVFLHRFKRLAGVQDAMIVALVFRRQLCGENISVGLADNFLQRLAEGRAEPHVSKCESAFPVLAKNVLRQRFDQRVIQHFRVLHRLFGPFAVGDVFDRPLEIQDVALNIAHDTGVLRNPDDAPVLAIDLRLEPGDKTIFLDEADKFVAPARSLVNLVIDVTDGGDEFPGRIVAVNTREHGIGREIMPVRSGLENPLHDVFEDAAVFFLRLAQRRFGAQMVRHRAFQFRQVATQFELHHDLMAQDAQRLDLRRGKLPRLSVQHTQGADGVSAFRRAQRHAGVKADVGIADHERVVGEPLVPRRVFHHEQFLLANGMRAEDRSRGVSDTSSPTFDLNHCRSSSTRQTRAMGALQICAASRVKSSKASSAGVSRTSYERNALSRSASLEGRGAAFTIAFCVKFLSAKHIRYSGPLLQSNFASSRLRAGRAKAPARRCSAPSRCRGLPRAGGAEEPARRKKRLHCGRKGG